MKWCSEPGCERLTDNPSGRCRSHEQPTKDAFDAIKNERIRRLMIGGPEMLLRFHEMANQALQELHGSSEQDETWGRICQHAQKLLDNMPETKGLESVLTVYLFFTSLDTSPQDERPSNPQHERVADKLLD